MPRTIHMLAGLALVAGCSGDRSVTRPARIQPTVASESHTIVSPDVAQDIATLRSVTAAFHDITVAAAAGWSTPITGCMADVAGGMGYHYGNVGLIDGAVRVDQPELLMYEPGKNGQMTLVGVEYIIPLSEWSSSAKPHLFGQDFHVNAQFQVWALHVWAWKENPNGIFADWNPRVSCEYASATTTTAH